MYNTENKVKTSETIRKASKSFSAEDLFGNGTSEHLVFDSKSNAVILRNNLLLENDSPGAGVAQNEKGVPHNSYDEVNAKTFIKKIFILEHSFSPESLLSFHAWEPQPLSSAAEVELASLSITVNGAGFTVKPYMPFMHEKYKNFRRPYWYYVKIPAGIVNKGTNEVIFRGVSEKYSWKIHFSEYSSYPSQPIEKVNQSLKSNDSGATWTSALGFGNSFEGEYNVRLNLKQYLSAGVLTSRIIDLADLEDSSIIEPFIMPGSAVKIFPSLLMPDGTEINVDYRNGDAMVLRTNRWSGWLPLTAAGISRFTGNFVQLRFSFSTKDPSVSPILKSVRIETENQVIPSPVKYFVINCNNEKIKRTSINFEYEKYDESKLVELRRKYQLDAIVRGCNTEFEKIIAISNWAARQYIRKETGQRDGYRFPSEWNSLELLEKGNGWFCLHHAIVFMQACLAMGLQCRIATMNPWSGSGHEVPEVWSNEYRKWIFIDPGYNYYVYNANTGVPMSLLEYQQSLRKEQDKDLLFEVLPGEKMIPLETRNTRRNDLLQYKIMPSPMNRLRGFEDFARRHEITCYFIRWMPRNNFLSRPSPLPLNQGTSVWPWDGYLNWHDDDMINLPQYSNFTARHADAYWTLNTVYFKLFEEPEKDRLCVQLDTETPSIRSLMSRIDYGDWADVTETFTWILHSGLNRLEVCSENIMGIKGPVSYVEISMHG